MKNTNRDWSWYVMWIGLTLGPGMAVIGVLPYLDAWMIGLIGVAPLVWWMVKVQQSAGRRATQRHCLECGYDGPMGTVLGSLRGGLLAFLLLMAALVPGVLYIVWRWNAPKCPKCGSIRKAVSV